MESPAASKSSPDSAQHSERHNVTMSIAQLVVLTALPTSFYAKMLNFGEVLHNVSYLRYSSGIRIALEAVLLKLHAKPSLQGGCSFE